METRGWRRARQATYRMRAKETSDDYRYFPEPDLPPLHVEPAWIDRVRAALPELPAARRARYEALGLRLRRGGARRRPGMTAAFEAISAAARRAGQGGLQLRDGIARASAQGDGLNEAATAGRRTPAGIAACCRGHRRGPVSRAGGRDLLDAAPRGRHAGRRLRIAARGPAPDLRRRVAARRTSTRSSPPTRRPSPTTGPASPVAGFFVGQVMKATGGAADAARVDHAGPRAPGRGGLTRWACDRLHPADRLGVALIVVGLRGPANRTGATWRCRSRTPTSRATRRGAAGVARTEDRGLGGDADAPPPGPDRRARIADRRVVVLGRSSAFLDRASAAWRSRRAARARADRRAPRAARRRRPGAAPRAVGLAPAAAPPRRSRRRDVGGVAHWRRRGSRR